ncbi:MAG: 1-(5-phosphoribosyl)-5-[(5-phosphoribosylamino)methylideneamino]imidazole-4-carboxamide isomerase [Trueperaceae bacterium]
MSNTHFEIIPAVDIQKGRAVRLYEGDPERETVYFEDPVAAALHWAELGAERLHLVDLDAALGRGDNSEAVRTIVASVSAGTELGGGIRSLDSALSWLEVVDRVILGTAAQREPELVGELIERVGPQRIAVSIDARGGMVAVRGWAETTDTHAGELAQQMAALGLRHLIYTDVSRDGTMQGVDPEPVRMMRDAFQHTLVAGGGVASDADLELYEELGLDGAIVGRALYEGRITYPRAS